MSAIRVLVVDDSAFARKVIRDILARAVDIEVVGIARDGLEALEKIAELKPDVVTLDLLMPDLDGLGVLRALPRESAPKVLIVSVSGSETEIAIEALQMGAVDVVTKPTPLPTDRLYELSDELVSKVRAAAIARPRFDQAPMERTAVLPERAGSLSTRLVVVGTSTGGPQALTRFIQSLPADLPFPLLVALHIPAGYTAPLAARISSMSQVPLAEARDGEPLLPGRGYIAPGGMHLRVKDVGGRLFASVSREPLESIYHPSVNLMFESAAEKVGAGVVGIIMTGMGDDGMKGSEAIRRAGGRVLAESSSSCVVYGMPRSVIEAGFATAEAPIERLAELLLRHV